MNNMKLKFIGVGGAFAPLSKGQSNMYFESKNNKRLLVQALEENPNGDLEEVGDVTFITTDTQYCPEQLKKIYDISDLIFHDCETMPFRSGVHAHYDDLATLPESVRSKMWLYHHAEVREAEADGFRGFVEKGQEFMF